MRYATPSRFSPRRSTMRTVAMNAILMALLTGVFLWSAAGNAVENIRSAIERL